MSDGIKNMLLRLKSQPMSGSVTPTTQDSFTSAGSPTLYGNDGHSLHLRAA